MSQDPKIMSAALSRFQADRDARRNALEARRREVYRRAPRVEMIDRGSAKPLSPLVSVTLPYRP